MPVTIEERVAYLEGKAEEHSRAWEELGNRIERVEKRIDALDQKIERFRDEFSSRVYILDQKVEKFRDELSSRIDALDQKFSGRIDALNQTLSGRIDALNQNFSRYFIWIIGIQMTIFLAIIATFLR